MVSTKVQGTKAIVPLPIKVEICLTSEQIIKAERQVTRLKELFIGTTHHIFFINNIADNITYELVELLKREDGIPTKIRKQAKHLQDMLHDYDRRIQKMMGNENNARCAFGTAELMDEVQDQIDAMEEEISKAVGGNKVLTKAILADMFETYAISNAIDRIAEFAEESAQSSLIAPFAHHDISKKVSTIATLLNAPDVSKELTLMSKFIKFQKQFLDGNWLADIVHRGIKQNEEQVKLLSTIKS